MLVYVSYETRQSILITVYAIVCLFCLIFISFNKDKGLL